MLQYLKDNGGLWWGFLRICHMFYSPLMWGFGPFKSFLQREVHTRAISKPVVDAFDVADIIRYGLSDALTVSNICSGFKKCEVWDVLTHTASVEPLRRLQLYMNNDSELARLPRLEVFCCFLKGEGGA